MSEKELVDDIFIADLARKIERAEIIAKGEALVERYNSSSQTSVLRAFLESLKTRD